MTSCLPSETLRADLTREQREMLAQYWWRRAEGEITSWVGFGHVLADLRAEGSPSAVIALAERSVADERAHASFCRDWAVHFGHAGGDPKPRSERPLTFPGASDRDNRLLRITLGCFTETVGCFLLRRVRASITDPELRRLNQRHLADELQHSRVGWAHLTSLDAGSRERVRQHLPSLFGILTAACCDGPELDREDLVPFGYFTPRVLRAAHDDALREVILPGLVHLGLRGAT
jgi:hypothetical protein